MPVSGGVSRVLSGRDITTGGWFSSELVWPLAKSEVADLTPLAGLTNLESITIQGGAIQDLTPLAGLKKLTFLNLSGNQIRNLTPLAGLTSLQHLELAHNASWIW